jgi:hypothetical protein
MSEQFIVTVDIKRVTRQEKKADYYPATGGPVREIEDITHLVVKADTMISAVRKVERVLNLEVMGDRPGDERYADAVTEPNNYGQGTC